jgi:hypothetical protein
MYFQRFIHFAVNSLFAVIDAEMVKGFVLEGAKKVKLYVEATRTDLDDKIVLPCLQLVLTALQIPGENGKVDIDGELKKLFNALGDLKDLFVDAGLDYIEDYVSKTENTMDDQVVLPMCRIIREVLNVPDNDSGDIMVEQDDSKEGEKE